MTVVPVGAALCLLIISACTSTPQATELLQAGTSSQFLEPQVLTDVVFFPQQEFQCGPAALATLLQASQVAVTPDELIPQVYLPARQGSLQIEILATTRRYQRLAYVLPPSLPSVLKEVQQGRPVLVMQNLGLSWYPRWHYAVVLGYDIGRGELILNSGKIEHYRVSVKLFERTWQRANHWAMVALKMGEKLPVDAEELSYFESLADLEHTLTATIKETEDTKTIDLETNSFETSNVELAYDIGLQRWPASELLAMGLGNVFYQQGHLQMAAKQFARVIELNPNYGPAHNNLALVLSELGDKENALNHARTALGLDDQHHDIYLGSLYTISAD